jgi:hypothetical protein
MKNSLLITAMAVFMCCLGGCEKEMSEENGHLPGVVPTTPTVPTTPGTGVTGDFRAKIDGIPFVANQVAGAVITNGIINITGTNTDGRMITITLTDSGVHLYQLMQTTINGAAFSESTNGSTIAFTSNASADPNIAGGTANITEINTTTKKISGTFAFKAYRPIDNTGKTITEGVFTNLTYTTDAVPAGNATDTFRVKVDGVDWVNYSGIATYANVPGFENILIVSNADASATTTIGLTVGATVTPGSYIFELFGDAMGQYNPNGSAVSYVADGGNLTILEHNTTTKRIRGTFNFPATPFMGTGTAINFTEGYFSMRYQ